MRLGTKERQEPEVSMAPMIDAVFLLLIFFLVVTMMKKENKDIEIVPPTSVSAIRKPADDKALVVGIDSIGGFYVEGEPSTANRLHDELRLLSIADQQIQIRVDADESAPFERVVQVLDLCQFRGLRNVVIRTYDERYNRK